MKEIEALSMLPRTDARQIEIDSLKRRIESIRGELYQHLTPWQRVLVARHPSRPGLEDYIQRLFPGFIEIHGDRRFADDHAIMTGFAEYRGQHVLLVGHVKGRDTKEKIFRNFGYARPEGYRKAMRVMELADRLGFPLLTLIDTPGAYPGLAAEQHGQGGMIARCQATMARLRVPTAACVIGEGGSGGAVAFAVADRVFMLEHSIYSVISPEGCAQILWRDGAEAHKAAAAMKPDARHCLDLGVIDGIVAEPAGGAQVNWDEAAFSLGETLRRAIAEVESLGPDERRAARRAKFRAMGATA